jgi:D-proline reductase (dithiol) PrdB
MASLDELRPKWRAYMRLYRYRAADRDRPWAPLRKPLSECRTALVTTAGLVAPGQPAFDQRARGGDYSLRVLDRDVAVAALRDCHRSDSFDHAGLRADPNLAFPLDRLRERASAGVIGEVAPRHISFMGSITAPGRLIRDTAPAAAEILAQDAVDAALLIPI